MDSPTVDSAMSSAMTWTARRTMYREREASCWVFYSLEFAYITPRTG
jgi:hypothetical protein